MYVASFIDRYTIDISAPAIFKSFEVADSQSDNYGIYNYTH